MWSLEIETRMPIVFVVDVVFDGTKEPALQSPKVRKRLDETMIGGDN